MPSGARTREGSFFHVRRRAGGAGRETERDGRMAIVEELEALREQTIAQIAQAADTAALEQVRIGVLGKAGTLTGYLRQMGQIAKEERAAVGKTANEVRAAVEGALAARKEELAASELAAAIDAAAVDVTLPGRSQQVGTRHLINRITDEISEIFLGLGYTVATGPEVETDYYNFEALNAPADHPSRSLADTFYVRDLSGALSDQGVSIAQAIQKGQSEAGVPLVFMTHEASVSAIRKAVDDHAQERFPPCPGYLLVGAWGKEG